MRSVLARGAYDTSTPARRAQPAVAEGGSANLHDDQDPAGPAPACFDTGVAHPARVYNYWLGGEDNYPADREAAEQVIAANPNIPRLGPAQLHRRTREQIAGYFTGLEMVRPGLVFLPEWRAAADPAHVIPCYAGVARKP
jgi:S-adenosyl methyltransferase